MTTIKNICVFCGSSEGRLPEYRIAAEKLVCKQHAGRTDIPQGELLVKNDIGLVYGGGSFGLMGIVSATVGKLGGRVIGVIPGALSSIEGMQLMGEHIVVDDMHTRKATMNSKCDAFIALPGGYGTFEEVFEMVTWNQLSIMSKPVCVVNVNGYYEPIRAMIDLAIREGFVRESARNYLLFAETVEEAIAKVKDFVAPVGFNIKWDKP